MREITSEELGVEIIEIPENFSVVINTDDIDIPNENKLFQVVLNEEIDNGSDDILVGLADFANGQIKPFSSIVSYWDVNGQRNPISQPHFPITYRKVKSDLVRLV